MKNKKNTICFLLCLIMVISLFGCGDAKQVEETFTYRQAISATPANFNPHDLSSDLSYIVLGYTSSGLTGV